AHWSRETMAARYRWLYARSIAAAGRTRQNSGLWLVTNNFSTGGAQSSARRLLAGLAAGGVRVRAAVVEEHPENPTPGRRALAEAGIGVLCVPFGDAAEPPPEEGDPLAFRCRRLLAAIDADPPEAVVFWNLQPAFKVALADALLD